MFLILGIIVIYFAFCHARCVWFIKQTPISAIGEVTTGYAAVSGHVAAKERTLEAPVTGRICVYFRFEMSVVNVERHYSAGGVIDCQCIPWGVDDGTGFAELILDNGSTQLPEKSKVHLTLDSKSGAFDPASFERAIQRYPADPWLNRMKSLSTFGGVKTPSDDEYAYRETIIRSEDILYVIAPVTVQESHVRFHSGKGPFIVSNKAKQNVLFRQFSMRWDGWCWDWRA
jgi:hypothetical protein